jgi:4-hydroxy-3-methylbut-2-enyl diphosphate reductase
LDGFQGMKQFDIPEFYRSNLVTRVKRARAAADKMKKDLSPTVLDFGSVRILLARHFGFCYGVENAIEISYKALEENPGKRIFLLSQMIHNQVVNQDLQDRGMRFIMDTEGNQFVAWDELTPEDIVIVPAFGTTLEIEKILNDRGIEIARYNTTCPFVEKVWKRSGKLTEDGHTIIIHGKRNHEETRATFSHASENGHSLIVKDLKEAKLLGDWIQGKQTREEFDQHFGNNISKGFDPENHLSRIGVVNQTTMLATETQEISDHLRGVMVEKYGADSFADTRDTLCYATTDNQSATISILDQKADVAIVVGGYNSSNTAHIVELCEEKQPTFFINMVDEIEDLSQINHFDWRKNERTATSDWWPKKANPTVIITSGASCPDALVEQVIFKLTSLLENVKDTDLVIEELGLDL